MRIDILDLQKRLHVDNKKLVNCARFTLKAMGEHSAELSVALVNDRYIKRFNLRYRGKNSSTDVLAFSMRDGGQALLKGREILGDVVISLETAKKEAQRRAIPFHKEVNRYLVHGILHLLGYQDSTSRERRAMKAKEEELLGAM